MTTYTKLNTGNWGLRGTGLAPTIGTAVTVSKKDGTQNTETIARIIWSGKDQRTGDTVWLAIPAPKAFASRSGSPRRGGRYECEECGDMVTVGSRCWETGMSH